MPRNKDQLFCFFSGFAHRDIELLGYQNYSRQGIVLLECKNYGTHILNKSDYIQLNGVLFEIVETRGLYFKASSTMELVNNTSIKAAKSGDKLTLGILAEKDLVHDCLWMLQPSAIGEVTYIGYSVLEDHEHTLKLDFEASSEMAPFIQEGSHLGLSGSSLTAREIEANSFLLQFSIYCGRETRRHSEFNQYLPLGTRVNITEAADIEHRLES